MQFCGKRATQTEQSRKHNQDTGRNLQITCSRPQVNDSGGARANGSSRLSGSTVKWGRDKWQFMVLGDKSLGLDLWEKTDTTPFFCSDYWFWLQKSIEVKRPLGDLA